MNQRSDYGLWTAYLSSIAMHCLTLGHHVFRHYITNDFLMCNLSGCGSRVQPFLSLFIKPLAKLWSEIYRDQIVCNY